LESDLELLRRYRRGDARAMDALVERHGSSVYAFCRRYLGAGVAVDDVVQEVWLRVLRASAGFDGRSRFTTWLFSIARNACIDSLRRLQRRRGRAPGPDEAPERIEAVEDPGPPVLDRVARQELSGLVEDAVDGLPDHLKEVFLLREQTDMTFTEIAESIDAPRETVKSRMRYALERIRRAVRSRLGEEVGPRGL